MFPSFRRVFRPALHLASLALVAGLLTATGVSEEGRRAADASTRLAPSQMQLVASGLARRGSRVIRIASAQKGVPYRYGGTSRRGFDCSGYTQFVFARVGERLPRVSHDQYRATRKISRSSARRGDLVFFHSGSKRGRVYHVGIYAGRGQIWHAPSTGKRVHKARIWTRRGVTFGRVR